MNDDQEPEHSERKTERSQRVFQPISLKPESQICRFFIFISESLTFILDRRTKMETLEMDLDKTGFV